MAKEKKGLIKEFKDFISKGNVLDMAVGVIVATAFGKITTSLVNDILLPFISWLFGAQDMSALNLVLRAADEEAGIEGITIAFGTLIGTIIDFILVALVVFLIVKAFNKAKEMSKKKEEEKPAEPPKPSEEVLLLREIRDSLKK